MIDNYDSFTYNLVQYLAELKQEVEVHRNDEITIEDIKKKNPQYIVLSPGPCTPNEAGVSLEVVNTFKGQIPILGVCLGHQTIGQAFGGKIIHELEPSKRGIYAGAVGYLGFDGDMDVAIAIRTGVIKNKTLYVQAGAGIVADSIPNNEWVETQNNAKAVLRAAEIVQSGK